MSITIIYRIDAGGDLDAHAKLSNDWRGAIMVWHRLGVAYGATPPEDPWRFIYNPKDTESIWALADDARLPEHERIVLLSTFDKALCRVADFPRLVSALRRFHDDRARNSSLRAQADAIERMAAEHPGCLGCGWQQTSAVTARWEVPVDKDHSRPYNVNRDTGHSWLFERLAEATKGT